jgi:hypothetical protein
MVADSEMHFQVEINNIYITYIWCFLLRFYLYFLLIYLWRSVIFSYFLCLSECDAQYISIIFNIYDHILHHIIDCLFTGIIKKYNSVQ